MKNPLSLSEIHQEVTTSPHTLINNRLKITNTSDGYINNLKLFINCKEVSILEQSIIRQRGILSYAPNLQCLELGNLAPDESAYFEYKFSPTNDLSTLSPHLILSFIPDMESKVTIQKVDELLLSTPETEGNS